MRYILTLSNLLPFVGYENIQLWTFLVWLYSQRMERNLYSFSAELSPLSIINFKLLAWVYMHRWIYWSNQCSEMSGCPILKVSNYFDFLYFPISQFLLFPISLFYITLPPTSTLRGRVCNCRTVTLSSAPRGLMGRDQSKWPKVHPWQMSPISLYDEVLSNILDSHFLLRVQPYSHGRRPVQVAKSSSVTDVSNFCPGWTFSNLTFRIASAYLLGTVQLTKITLMTNLPFFWSRRSSFIFTFLSPWPLSYVSSTKING